MNNILITGGMGFIGSSLVQEMSIKNYNITILDIVDNNKGNKFYKNDVNINFIEGDINNQELLTTIINDNCFDGILHFAGVSRVDIAEQEPDNCLKTNVDGTKSLLDVLKSSTNKNKPWFIFASSREVYGEPNSLPVNEEFDKKHLNIYGKSKIDGEKLVTTFSQENENKCLILRFANVYGNEFDIFDRVIPKFLKAIHTNKGLVIDGGKQVLDFAYIDDTVKSIMKAINYIEHMNKMLDDFNISTGIGYTLIQVIETIESILQKKALVTINEKRTYDVEQYIGDPTKSKRVLKLEKFLSLEEGLKLAIPRYLKAMK